MYSQNTTHFIAAAPGKVVTMETLSIMCIYHTGCQESVCNAMMVAIGYLCGMRHQNECIVTAIPIS